MEQARITLDDPIDIFFGVFVLTVGMILYFHIDSFFPQIVTTVLFVVTLISALWMMIS